MRNRGVAWVAAWVAAFLILLLGACTNEPPPEAAPEPTPASTPSPEPPPVCPLTGEKPNGVDLGRPAVAVKVSNSPDARPQNGLDKADVVYEEIVEGGITRFMAIFHCGDAAQLGPIRSARFDDPKIAKQFTRILAFSGSNAIVDRELEATGMVQLTELNGGDVFFRVPPGVLNTHNLFLDTKGLRKLARNRAKKLHFPKSAFFEFGELEGAPRKAKSVEVHFNASTAIEWRYGPKGWKRFEVGAPFMAASGKQITVPNVLVQEVDVNNSPTIVDVAGNPSPDIALIGKGRAFLFRDGKVIKGTWKAKEGSSPQFLTKSGEPFVFEPGPTWVELVPSDKGAVKGSITISKK